MIKKAYIYTLPILIALSLGITSAKNHVDNIFIFGIATSFNDSTVYFTDIQSLDSARLHNHNKFLVEREQYSFQLKNYLSNLGKLHFTCVTFFSTKREKLKKERLELKKKYLKKDTYKIIDISQNKFRYNHINSSNCN